MDRRDFLMQAALVLGGAFMLPSAFAQISTINDAINKSGRQRMLSQRIAKAYLQIGLGIEVDRSRKILEASQVWFEKQLADLLTYAPTTENRQVFEEMKKVWTRYDQVINSASPNLLDAKAILAVSDETLGLAQKATVQLEKYSGTVAGTLVNISGRERMLSQRMAKFYQALQWGVASNDANDKLEGARKDFVAGLNTLGTAASNTTKIKEDLALAKQQWLFFDNALRDSGKAANKQQYANNVATTSERILEVMDGITAQYQLIA